ncbi:hypothetical protein TNCV_163581 [Trichonephila clavipes]|nr:hypothetical protein TNCV_163581 [Trichonephila clavipes]
MSEHPPYSPYLSLPDFHNFNPLDRALRFNSDEEVEKAVQSFLKYQLLSFYSEEKDLQPIRKNLCYNAYGDFFRFLIKKRPLHHQSFKDRSEKQKTVARKSINSLNGTNYLW